MLNTYHHQSNLHQHPQHDPHCRRWGFSAHRASSPLHRVRKICLGSERPCKPLTFPPWTGTKRASFRPPAHQARASGLNHPHVVRLADPDYHRCAVFVRLSAHKPRCPRLPTSRCEISSRRRYAAATELRALGRTSTASHPALARLGHLAIAVVVGLFEPDACGP